MGLVNTWPNGLGLETLTLIHDFMWKNLTFWTILVKIINKYTKMILVHCQLPDFPI